MTTENAYKRTRRILILLAQLRSTIGHLLDFQKKLLDELVQISLHPAEILLEDNAGIGGSPSLELWRGLPFER